MRQIRYTLPEVEPAKLQAELDAHFGASASAGLRVFDNRFPMPDEVTIILPFDPSQDDLDSIDGIVQDHKAYAPLRIYGHVPFDYEQSEGSHDPPFDLDYTTGLTKRLCRRNDMTFGEVHTITYSEDDAHASAVVIERVSYVRDEVGFAQERTTEISWVDIYGEEHPKKKYLRKTYSPDESLREGQRRRKNIIDELMMNVGGALIQTQQVSAQEALQLGRELFKDYAIDEKAYTETSDPSILADFKNDQEHSWLDDELPGYVGTGYTIRRFCFDSCNIWGYPWEDF